VKKATRREGHQSIFKTQGKTFMILNQRSLEKIAGIAPETLNFMKEQRDKIPRSHALP
jgi:hypothetical protein